MAQEQNISQDLYDLLTTRGFDPEITDEKGKPTQSSEGSVFSFDYIGGSGRNYGTAVALIDDKGELQLYYGDNLGRTMEEPDKTEWFNFLRHLKNFATRQNLYTFAPKNLNQLKHTMAGMAAIKEGLFEGYYGTRRISYMGEETDARLMIRHRKNLAETDKRHLNVESLFIETAEGERFKLPFTHLAGGRAMLEHVRQGGRPYDVRGVHITEMVSELKVLSRFNRASSGRVVEGVTQQLVEQARTYYKNLRETLKSLSRERGYTTYFETWTPLTETESESLVEDIKTLFVEQTLDARIEAALPVLAKIKETQMREADIFESYIDRLAEGTWALPDTPEAERKLQELMAQELPVGPDATNVTEQLYDVLGDDDLYDQLEALARENPDADARPLIQARLEEMGFDIGMNDEPDADQDLDEELQQLPFGTVNVVTPAEQRQKYKKFVQELVADGVPEKTAYAALDLVRDEVMRGARWDDAVEVALRQYGIDDPYRLEREQEREQEYNADQDRVRQQTVKTLQNFYKQVRQRQGRDRAQALARLRDIWNQGTPEEQAEADRMFGDDPQWQQIKSKLVMKPSQPVGEAAYSEARNEQGLTQQEWMRKLKAAGGRIIASAKMPNGPIIGELNGKRRTWKPMQAEADNLSTFEGSGCNHTMEGESCPVHGLSECGMYEGNDREDYNRTAAELNQARQSGDLDRVKELTGELLKRAGPRGFEIDIRGDARPMQEDALDRIKNLALSKTR